MFSKRKKKNESQRMCIQPRSQLPNWIRRKKNTWSINLRILDPLTL